MFGRCTRLRGNIGSWQTGNVETFHQMFYDEFDQRDLEIKLLATDASPFVYWPTIEWAAENMDDITID